MLEKYNSLEMSVYNTEEISEADAKIYLSWSVNVIYNTCSNKYYKYI